jgi:hypothetical protein
MHCRYCHFTDLVPRTSVARWKRISRGKNKMLLFAAAKLSMKRAVRRMHETGERSRWKGSKVKEDPQLSRRRNVTFRVGMHRAQRLFTAPFTYRDVREARTHTHTHTHTHTLSAGGEVASIRQQHSQSHRGGLTIPAQSIHDLVYCIRVIETSGAIPWMGDQATTVSVPSVQSDPPNSYDVIFSPIYRTFRPHWPLGLNRNEYQKQKNNVSWE